MSVAFNPQHKQLDLHSLKGFSLGKKKRKEYVEVQALCSPPPLFLEVAIKVVYYKKNNAPLSY